MQKHRGRWPVGEPDRSSSTSTPSVFAWVADELEAWSRTVHVTDSPALHEAVDELVRDHGPLGAMVGNAATIAIGSVADLDPVAFERVIEVNLTGVYRSVLETLPHLLGSRGYLLVVDSARP